MMHDLCSGRSYARDLISFISASCCIAPPCIAGRPSAYAKPITPSTATRSDFRDHVRLPHRPRGERGAVARPRRKRPLARHYPHHWPGSVLQHPRRGRSEPILRDLLQGQLEHPSLHQPRHVAGECGRVGQHADQGVWRYDLEPDDRDLRAGRRCAVPLAIAQYFW